MKTLLVLSAVLAAVAAEADPQYLTYGGYGHYPYSHYPSVYHNPFLYPTLKKAEEPVMKEEDVKVEDVKKTVPLIYSPYYGYPQYGLHHYGYGHYPYYQYAPYVPAVEKKEEMMEEKSVEKRDAESDPLLLIAPVTYTHPYTYQTPVVGPVATHTTYTYPHYPLVYTTATGCQNHLGSAVPCAYGTVAAAAPVVEKKVEKREAEADPEAYWYGNYYNAYAHYPYYNTYANAYYAPYHYAVGGCRNNFGAVVPCA